MDVLKDISSCHNNLDTCSCSTLTVDDVPGAKLLKPPEKCKKNELEFWLKCRGFTVKKSETKAKLSDRVRQALNQGDNYKIVDPDPSQCHLRRKISTCTLCVTVSTCMPDANATVNPVNVSSSILTNSKCTYSLPKDGWTRSTEYLPSLFSHISIMDHAKTSGRKQFYVEKPIEKGYRFFFDGYVHSVLCSKDEQFTYLKAKCFRSMRKNELPHTLSVKLCSSTGGVKQGHCSCVAGATAHCNHVFALLYVVDHVIRMKLKNFPLHSTCTDKPVEWNKSRTDGITAEPVMDCHVIKSKYGTSSSGIQPTLYEARGQTVKEHSSNQAIELFNDLKSAGISCGFFSVLNTSESRNVHTRMDKCVPVGSVLSYQLAITEANFSVVENIHIDKTTESESQNKFTPLPENIPPFPWTNDASAPDIENNVKTSVKVNIESNEAVLIEKDTIEQNSCDKWFQERAKRLTASKFGLVMNRKTENNTQFVKNTLIGKNDLSNVPAVKYGLDNENRAVNSYMKYMCRARNKVHCFKSGLVVNSKFPWAAASPDRKVYDLKYGLGLLEVKCAYKFKDVKPINACDDPSFFCEKTDTGHPRLKRSHHYYAQVQGQLGVCGAKWCDFVVYTNKGLLIERISFDKDFWNTMMSKLRDFYIRHMVPVITSISST